MKTSPFYVCFLRYSHIVDVLDMSLFEARIADRYASHSSGCISVGYIYTFLSSSSSSSSLFSFIRCVSLAPIVPRNWARISWISTIFFAYALFLSCTINHISSFTSGGTLKHFLVLLCGPLCIKWNLNRVMPPFFISNPQKLQIVPFLFPSIGEQYFQVGSRPDMGEPPALAMLNLL